MDPMAAGAAALALIFAGMITTQILTHFDLLVTNTNGTKKYKCKVCGKEIVCQGDQKLKFHVGRVANGGVAPCSNPHPEMLLIFKKEIETTVNAKRALDAGTTGAGGAGSGAAAAGASPPKRGQPSIACSFGSMAKVEADQAVVSWCHGPTDKNLPSIPEGAVRRTSVSQGRR